MRRTCEGGCDKRYLFCLILQEWSGLQRIVSSEPSKSSLRNGGKVGSIVIVGQKEAFSPIFRSANSCCFTDPILDEKTRFSSEADG